MKALTLFALAGVLILGRGQAASAHAATATVTAPAGDLVLEMVGQVTGSAPGVTPATSAQYGYLPYVRGVDTTFKATPENETTALYTFYTETTTSRVITNGPLQILTRHGTTTLYQDTAANGQFANPNTFKDGTPIQISTLHQQVVKNNVTGSFSAVNFNTITSATPFTTNGHTVQLGRVGQKFRVFLSGQSVSTPPPVA
ncbi:MAG: hypothetical protein ACR2JC_08310 [Chloroflexota bacterium]